MIIIGLDFGTHQSKICIEDKKGVELSYSFFQFSDTHGEKQYTLPSIIRIKPDSKLEYGYLKDNGEGKIIRYFKQATFCTQNSANLSENEGKLFSIWYLANILFDLEEIYGKEFVVQMGAPTDTANLQRVKAIAVEILGSAYYLVEDVYKNNKEKFLNTTYEELVEKTTLIPYSKDELKDKYEMLVFPEAYACLMPLVKSSKIADGMSLMVDIGGGTTDISFFTIENSGPQVYAFYSINKGLNFLIDAENKDIAHLDSNVKSEQEIHPTRRDIFRNSINAICQNLIGKLQQHFKKQTKLQVHRLMDALKIRPIIYTGGGSTFPSLRERHAGFRDKIHISEKEWRTKSVKDLDIIIKQELCPILSTAYGLSISVTNDDIECHPLPDIFSNIRGTEEEKDLGFSYGDDYDAWK